MPVVLFYLLIDWPIYVQRAIALVPPRLRAQRRRRSRDECDAVLGQYLRGQLLVMLMLAAYYSVGLALFGFELAVPVGVFTGLAIFVPYVGFGIGLLLALLAGALQFTGWYGPIAVFVVYGIGQIVEGLFLTPRLVGERIGMSTLTVIFALFAFGHLFGFVGVLIALPVSALIAVAAARLRASYTQSSLYTRMKQIPLAIGPEPARTFDNFLPGANARGARPPARAGAPARRRSTSGARRQRQDAPAARARRTAPRAARRASAAGSPAATPRAVGDRRERDWLVSTTAHALDAAQQHAAFALFVDADDARRRHRRRRHACRRSTCRCATTCARRLGWGHVFALAAARRGRGARGAAPRGRPARHLPLRRGDGLPADPLRARPEAPDGAARPPRRVLARQQARDHGAAAEADARRGEA